MIIEEIEKQIINLLPTSNILLDEVDYSILEERKKDWKKLSEVTHSIVLAFDCYTKKFVFVSDNIPELYGLDSHRLFIDGHQPVVEVIHPDDIYYGLIVRKKIYSILSSFSNEEKMNYKAIHEMRVRNLRGEYIRIIEQEQVIELDKSGNIWLMLSVIDVDASHESEIIKSHLYNFKTGEQIFIDLSDTLDEPLTNRELEVLRLMKQGLLSKEIANTLKVSINTVNTHRQNILQKLKANNSIEAVNFAQRLGLFIKYILYNINKIYNNNITIVDLFIDILSKNKDTQSQNMVKCLKVFIRIPECAEFLNVIIINAMGYKSQIKSTTVDKAVECIINQSNNRVDEDNSLDEHQKQQIKKDNEIILRMCADITKNKLKETEQLIED